MHEELVKVTNELYTVSIMSLNLSPFIFPSLYFSRSPSEWSSHPLCPAMHHGNADSPAKNKNSLAVRQFEEERNCCFTQFSIKGWETESRDFLVNNESGAICKCCHGKIVDWQRRLFHAFLSFIVVTSSNASTLHFNLLQNLGHQELKSFFDSIALVSFTSTVSHQRKCMLFLFFILDETQVTSAEEQAEIYVVTHDKTSEKILLHRSTCSRCPFCIFMQVAQ